MSLLCCRKDRHSRGQPTRAGDRTSGGSPRGRRRARGSAALCATVHFGAFPLANLSSCSQRLDHTLVISQHTIGDDRNTFAVGRFKAAPSRPSMARPAVRQALVGRSSGGTRVPSSKSSRPRSEHLSWFSFGLAPTSWPPPCCNCDAPAVSVVWMAPAKRRAAGETPPPDCATARCCCSAMPHGAPFSEQCSQDERVGCCHHHGRFDAVHTLDDGRTRIASWPMPSAVVADGQDGHDKRPVLANGEGQQPPATTAAAT